MGRVHGGKYAALIEHTDPLGGGGKKKEKGVGCDVIASFTRMTH